MDKKLNEVTKVTDMAYVPVIMADGSVGQIAKSDLASVVAGMLGNPVGTKGYIENVYPNISSYDEVVSSGIYTVSDSVSVSPKNGVLVVNASSAVVCQTFYEQNGVNQSRLRWYGNWTPWQRIDNFGYNSLAELSAGVAEQDPIRSGLYNEDIPSGGTLEISSKVFNVGFFICDFGGGSYCVGLVLNNNQVVFLTPEDKIKQGVSFSRGGYDGIFRITNNSGGDLKGVKLRLFSNNKS